MWVENKSGAQGNIKRFLQISLWFWSVDSWVDHSMVDSPKGRLDFISYKLYVKIDYMNTDRIA